MTSKRPRPHHVGAALFVAAVVWARAAAMVHPAIPAQLVGTWRLRTSSASDFRGPAGGSRSMGGSMSWTFRADGHFLATLYERSTIHDCVAARYREWKGTVEVHDDTIMTLHETDNREHGEGNCGARSYDTTLPRQTESQVWKIVEHPPAPPELWVTSVARDAVQGPRFDRYVFQSR